MLHNTSVDPPPTTSSTSGLGTVADDMLLQMQQARMMSWEDATHRHHERVMSDGDRHLGGQLREQTFKLRADRCREIMTLRRKERMAAAKTTLGHFSHSGVLIPKGVIQHKYVSKEHHRVALKDEDQQRLQTKLQDGAS